jgi:hypothetical protein
MVKDHRTNYESSNPTSVLDGSLNGFMEAYLRSQVGEDDAQQRSEGARARNGRKVETSLEKLD